MKTLLINNEAPSSSIILKTIDDLLSLHKKTIKLEKLINNKYHTFQIEIDMDNAIKGMKMNSCTVIVSCDALNYITKIKVQFWYDILTRELHNYELLEPSIWCDEGYWSIKELEKHISDLKDDETILKQAFFFELFSLRFIFTPNIN